MTPQDEIIEIARQAGFPFNKYGLLQGDVEGEIDADAMFVAFAKLVMDKAAEREREACANLMFDLDLCAHEGKAADAIRARGNKE